MNSRKKKLAAAAMLFASVFGTKKSEALNPQLNTQISKKNNLTIAPLTRKFNKDLLLKIGIPSAVALLVGGGILTWALWPKNKDVKKINPDVHDPNKPENIDDINNIDDANGGDKNIKPILPININEIKKLHFDNITTADQMFNALVQIADSCKFFGLKSSDVGFNDEKFNIFEKRKEIQQILSLINYKGKRNKMNEIEIIPKASGNDIDQIIKKKELSRTIELNSDKKLKGIQIYNSKNTQNENEHFASLKMSIGKEKRFNNRYIPSKVLKIPKYNTPTIVSINKDILNNQYI